MPPRPSSRALGVEPFLVMDMLAEAGRLEAQGRDIVHMEVGQPAGSAPASALAAARAALDTGRLGYTEALGLSALRARIARHYGERYGVDLDPARVVVTTGSSAGFVLAFLAAFDVGARVALARPGYPAYRNILRGLGLEPVEIETGPESRWTLAAAQVEAAAGQGLAGVLVASPANPTGTMLAPQALAELASVCAGRGLWLVSDEIYHGLTWGQPEATALAHTGDAIVINSFSKYYCMTGWRVGWTVVPERLVRPVECLAQNLYIAPPSLSQHAALAAFDATAELEARKTVYHGNRDFLLDALPRLGIAGLAPADGAFYLYADVGHLTDDSAGFARRLLAEAGVATTPCADFDPIAGHRSIRLSYAGARDRIEEGVSRLARWLAGV